MKKYFIIPLIVGLLSSCAVKQHASNDKVFNKRKYRKGYHFQGFKTAYKKGANVESVPRIKVTRDSENLALRIKNTTRLMDLPQTRSIVLEDEPVKPISIKNETPQTKKIIEPVKLAENRELQVQLPTQNSVDKITDNIQKQVTKASKATGKYGLALGLNSVGTSVVSKLGVEAEGETPWLALIIPTFIFVSSSVILFARAKRRKEQDALELETLKANMSGTELAAFMTGSVVSENKKSIVSKRTVAVHATLYAAVIAAWIYVLY